MLGLCAAKAVMWSVLAGKRKLNKAEPHSKIDGLIALSMALVLMAPDESVSATSP